MHIGMLTLDVTGHLNPMTSLGGALAQRGHRVTLLGGRVARAFAENAGIDFAPIGVGGDRDVELADAWRILGRCRGLASMRQTGFVMAATSRVILDDVPHVLDECPIDALLVDQFTPAGLAVAERRDLPSIVVCNALVSHRDPYAPPPALNWRYRRNPWGRLRNLVAEKVIPPVYNRFADTRTTGIRPLQLVFEAQHGLAQIAQQPAFFDYPRHLPDHFHYTAPWHAEDRDDEIEFPWDWLDGRPLLYASMGTLQNNLPHVFAAIVDAVRGLDAQVVLTQGGSCEELKIDPPENVLIVRRAPQLRLLDRADLAITHAGLNTALECLSRGVPMVCLPVTNDQPGVARRVEWLGLGEVLPIRRICPRRLRKRIERVLLQPCYRSASEKCRRALADHDGLGLASQIVLQALGVGSVPPPIGIRARSDASTVASEHSAG